MDSVTSSPSEKWYFLLVSRLDIVMVVVMDKKLELKMESMSFLLDLLSGLMWFRLGSELGHWWVMELDFG